MNPKTARLAVSALLFATAGCHGTVAPAPAGYAEVPAAPVYITSYPSVAYEGHATYFYGNHWWYEDAAKQWTYYRTEPEALRRQRPSAQEAFATGPGLDARTRETP
jgi:hypothetical protein